MTSQERQSESVSEIPSTSKTKPKQWIFWHSKRPLEPFFGPDDYTGWGTVQEEMDAHSRIIHEWHAIHKQLSLWDRVKHFFSSEGCFVKVRDHPT